MLEQITIELPADVVARLRQEPDLAGFVAEALRARMSCERTRTLLAGYADLSNHLIRRELRSPIAVAGPEPAPATAAPAPATPGTATVATCDTAAAGPADCRCEPLSPVQLAARAALPVPDNVPIYHPPVPQAPQPAPVVVQAAPTGGDCSCGCAATKARRTARAMRHVTALPAAVGTSAVPAIAGSVLSPAARVRPLGDLPAV